MVSLFGAFLKSAATADMVAVGKGVKTTLAKGENNLVGKILRSRETLQSSDLSGQCFNSVLNDLKREGIDSIKVIPLKNGGYAVHADDIQRTGVCSLFPGGVMTPNNGRINRIAFKFNESGDCVQLTGIQKHLNEAVSGSTIRTSQEIEYLHNAGVHNPTEYIQVYAHGGERYVNKTFSPFGDKPKSINTPTVDVVKQEVKSVEDLLTDRYNTTLERIRRVNPQRAERIEASIKNLHDTERGKIIKAKHKQNIVDSYENLSEQELTARVAREQKEFLVKKAQQEAEEKLNNSTQYIQRTLAYINPELSEKVTSRIYTIAEKDPVRAQKLADNLIERYSGDVEQFRPKSSRMFSDDIFRNPLDDDLFKSPFDNNLF